MEQQRLFLFAALFFIGYLLYVAWQDQFNPTPPPIATPSISQQLNKQAAAQVGLDQLPTETFTGSANQLPTTANDTSHSSIANSSASGSTPITRTVMADSGQRIHITTDVFNIDIDLVAGDVRRVDLLKYPLTLDEPDHPIRLLNDQGSNIFVAQSGFMSLPKNDQNLDTQVPGQKTSYRSVQTHYEMGERASLQVDLNWLSPQGVSIIKRFTFTRGSYAIKLSHIVKNTSNRVWQGVMRHRLLRSQTESSGTMMMGSYSYIGGVIYSDAEKYEKIDFDDMSEQDLSRDVSGGWIAMIQHYFLGAWIPDKKQPQHFFSSKLSNNRFYLGMNSSYVTVQPQQQQTVSSQLYIGPKIQEILETISPGLELTVDYTFLTVIAKPLHIALTWIHKLVGNWGWAIILLTIGIKAVFYKLSETSYKSMANMRRMQPRMAALKERFAGDRSAMNQAVMQLYKKEKINPLGGCLPIVIQIPVFIALYWVLLESVEMRQAPWMLWINDLSTKDPFFVLPVIMGVTMLIQQKLNPAPLDPIQAKVMMMLPIVFTVFFAFFPSGLVLYWVVNNTLSILQQWYITRIVIGNSDKSKTAKSSKEKNKN